jgi:hypothetical protein
MQHGRRAAPGSISCNVVYDEQEIGECDDMLGPMITGARSNRV